MRTCFHWLMMGAVLIGTGLGADEGIKPANIRKKDGTVVTGAIKGTLIQGHAAPVEGGGHGALYYFVPGTAIAAIDENGVHYHPDTSIRYANIGQKKPIDVMAVAKTVTEMDGGNFTAMFSYSSANEGAAISTNFLRPEGATGLPLLGEYRTSPEGAKLLQRLEINTDKGTVELPLSEIVPFKAQPGKTAAK